MLTKNLFFSFAVRGFHVYKRNLKPEEGELLKRSHEKDNLYDIFSIKVCKSGTDELAGHLPMQISRITIIAWWEHDCMLLLLLLFS